MKKVIPKGVWSKPVEVDLTEFSLENFWQNLNVVLERIEILKDKIVEIKGVGFSDPVPSSLADLSSLGSVQNLANKTLNETITGLWTFSSPTAFSKITGTNTQNLTISGKNLGVEIRVDENSDGTGTFKITKGPDSSPTELLTLISGSGNLGINNTNPTEKLDVNGNVKAGQFISTATTGTPPFQLLSTDLVSNLNADLLDGFHASVDPTPNTVVVRDNLGQIAEGLSLSTFQIRRYYGYIEDNSPSSSTNWAKIATLNFPASSTNNGASIIFEISRDSDTYSYPTKITVFIDYIDGGTKKAAISLEPIKPFSYGLFITDVAVVETSPKVIEIWIKVNDKSKKVIYSAEVMGSNLTFNPTIGAIVYDFNPPITSGTNINERWSTALSPSFLQSSGIVDMYTDIPVNEETGYIRYDNGVQVVWKRLSNITWDVNFYTSNYYTYGFTVVFPALFLQSPTVLFSGKLDLGAGVSPANIFVYDVNTSFADIRVRTTSSYADMIYAFIFAIGRWR
jgi:hypothetical protein